MDDQELHTHYANTDLEIGSIAEPSALRAAFHQHEFFAMTEQTLEDGSWLGRYETGEQYKEPDANIAGFLDIIDGLNGTALDEWQTCPRREFDIGYMSGYEPFSFEQILTIETLSRVVKAGAVIRLTVYAADPKHAHEATKRLRVACKRPEKG